MDIVEESIKIHDKHQFEFKFTYPVDPSAKNAEYFVETYFFIPNNLGVDYKTYTKEEFYNDTQKYIRLKTPAVLLKNILAEALNSPFKPLEKSMKELVNNPKNEGCVYNYKYHLKMFCSIFKSAARDEETFIEDLTNQEEISLFIDNFLANTDRIIRKFRALKNIVHVPSLEQKHYALFLFADEYLSLMLDKYKYKLLFFLKRIEIKDKKRLNAEVLKRIHDEIVYRKSQSYPSIPDENSDNEALIYRMSTLKKIMGSILFLKTRTSREGKFLEQWSMGLGAGVAMAFATGVAFLSRWQLNDFTLTFFISLVIAYIFKDRIKELTRSYIYNKVQKYIYDHKTTIFSNPGKKIGFCRESFSFIQEKNLPENIKKLRNKDYITELDNGYVGENIMYSKRHIKIYCGKCKTLFNDFNVDGINDIIRFNIRHFLNKMDNPEKRLFMPDSNDAIKRIRGARVYHLNLVLKYVLPDNSDAFRHFRIILNRDGIKRINEAKTTTI